MIKKLLLSLLLFLTVSIPLCFINVSVFAEEIQSKVTVRIIHDDALEPEKPKESTNDSSKQKYKESNMKLNKKNRLPQTNERINLSISIIGLGVTGTSIQKIAVEKRTTDDKLR